MKTKNDFAEMLRWYVEAGITTAIGEMPINHYAPLQHIKKVDNPDSGQQTMTSKSVSAKLVSNPETAFQYSKDIARQCQSLSDLRDALAVFEECALKKTATNLVFGEGNPDAEVMLVGEAPGADEDRQGIPFVGISGQLLTRMLGCIGLKRSSVYITNIVPWRPPGNRQPTPQEIGLCHPFIERHIELIKPKILVLVGGIAVKALLQTSEGITKVRGTWKSYESSGLLTPIKAIATYHPAFLLRSPGQKAQAWLDMIMIKKALIK